MQLTTILLRYKVVQVEINKVKYTVKVDKHALDTQYIPNDVLNYIQEHTSFL